MSPNVAFDLVIVGGGIVGLWTAMEARRASLSVLVVEVGGRSLDGAANVSPPLTFPDRPNTGAVLARHHVLTGNSAFWGGGLIRNPRSSLARVIGAAIDDPELDLIERAYGHVEKQLLGGRRTGASGADATVLAGLHLADIVVLPGRRRGLWSEFLGRAHSNDDGLVILSDCRVVSVDVGPDRRVRRLQVECGAERTRQVIAGNCFVLSMGVVDSNVEAVRLLAPFMDARRREWLGRGLHDHWSVHVADVSWKNGTALSLLFPPKVTPEGIVGRRLAFEHGFFHLGVDYDKLQPYKQIKEYLAARQAGMSLTACASRGLRALGHPWLMLRVGWHYLRAKELLVADGTSVRLCCDFESADGANNRLVPGPERVDLHWSLTGDDHARFANTLQEYRAPLGKAAKECGLDVSWRVTDDGLREYLDANALDAYHLGGGLSGSTAADSDRITGTDGRMLDFSNVFVMSTASFFAPGIANPVLTLLARASALIDRLHGRRVST